MAERKSWDSDAACEESQQLWLAVAAMAKERCIASEDALGCLIWAKVADCANWQATGEGDCTTLSVLVTELTSIRKEPRP